MEKVLFCGVASVMKGATVNVLLHTVYGKTASVVNWLSNAQSSAIRVGVTLESYIDV
jgi:hypothetical protein